jgi:hypothetical protein
VALDDQYANKFAPLDSMAINPKLGHQLLYTPVTDEMKCPRLYLCHTHSTPSPSMSMQHMHQHDQQRYNPLYNTPCVKHAFALEFHEHKHHLGIHEHHMK